jgi:hypothetical protein
VDQIVEAERMVFNLEADGKRLAGGEVLLNGGSRKCAAKSGVDLRTLGSGGFFALGFQFLRGAEAAVGFAFSQQALRVLGIDGQALGLAVGAAVAFAGQA